MRRSMVGESAAAGLGGRVAIAAVLAMTVTSSSCTDSVMGTGEDALRVAESSLLIVKGTQVQLGRDVRENGRSLDAREVSWSSDDTTIATVDSVGTVTAVKPGETKIRVAHGNNTKEVPAAVFDPADGDFVAFPTPEIAFILGPQLASGSVLNPWPWFDANAIATGLKHGPEFDANPAERSYYDQARVQYLNYYRTGDTRFLGYARHIADAWYEHVQPQGTGIAPRSVALSGIMLRALDGRPEMWDWILTWTNHHMNVWLETRLSNTTLHYGLRDGGYALYYGALVAAAHPSEAVRAEYTQRVLTVARDYYARLQYPNGGWYWGDSTDEERIQKADGSYWLHAQPFMVGIMLEGLVAAHQLTDDDRVADAIAAGAEWLYQYGYRLEPSPLNGLPWRGGWYTVFEPGTPLPGLPQDPSDIRYAADGVTVVQGTTALRGGNDPNTVREVRQHNTLQVHVFGYAYQITGDTKFRTMGDEVFSASYGKGQGPGADISYSLADYIAKSYNQAYRSSGTYLARRLGR